MVRFFARLDVPAPSGYRSLRVTSRNKIVLLVVVLVALPVVVAVVLVVLGAAGALFTLSDARDSTERALAEQRANALVTAAQMRQMELGPGACPTIADLASDPFLGAEGTVDPWGTELVLECDGEALRAVSFGPDRERGTDDDVVVEDRPAE
jgi:hypothetical protein